MIELDHVLLPLQTPVCNKEPINIYPGKITCISGKSGTGKTTFLYQLGLMSEKLNMTYKFNGKTISDNEEDKSYYRKHKIAYVFQDYCLIDYLSIEENIHLMLDISGEKMSEQWLNEMKKHLNLEDINFSRKPSSLSGGQRQRVAILCAMAKKPDLLILDEPTSALDKENTKQIIQIIKNLVASYKVMIVIATHSKEVMDVADYLYRIENHLLYLEKRNEIEQSSTTFSKDKESHFNYLKYSLNYYKKHINQKVLLNLISAVSLSLLVVCFFGFKSLISRQSDHFNHASNLQLVIDTNEEITNDQIKQVEKLKGINYILPKYYINGLIDKTSVEIINANIDTNSINEAGNYISYNLANQLHISTYPSELSIDVDNNVIKLTIDGALPSLVGNFNHSSNFIYIEDDLFHQYFTIENATQLVVICNSINDAISLQPTLESYFGANSIYSEYETLKASLQSLQMYKMYSLIILSAIFFISFSMMLIIYIREISNREYEICLLKANGLNSKEINKLMVMDGLIMMIITFILSAIISFILTLIFNKFFYSNISIPSLVLVVITIIIYVLPLGIGMKKCSSINPTSYMRS